MYLRHGVGLRSTEGCNSALGVGIVCLGIGYHKTTPTTRPPKHHYKTTQQTSSYSNALLLHILW